jgi:adenylyltransferase/sulfurtransferase
MARYHRQILLPLVGRAGQEKLAAARVLLVGCGALGSVIADQLVRAGVGWMRIADRDVVELTNLQRQVLFDEDDARNATPKAVAAARRLAKINSSVIVEPAAVDVHAANIEELIATGGSSKSKHVDLILDGTDNAATRYLLNDVAVKHRIPWVYGACVGTQGRVMSIRPAVGPCLRCVFLEMPGPGELATCDTAGVLGPAAAIVASLQSIAAIRLLLGEQPDTLVTFDAWTSRFRTIDTSDARREDCPCCGRRQFPFLSSTDAEMTTTLCGRHAVQVHAPAGSVIDLNEIGYRLSAVGKVRLTPFFLRCRLDDPPEIELTLFPDGRLLVRGTADMARARSYYARFIGA